jgi:hypothetical protein
LVINYKELNAKTIIQQWPLPRIDSILANIGNSIIFSKIDLKSGFYQLPLAEQSKHLTVFTTMDGTYEFEVGAFGLKNMPKDFSKLMKPS